MIKLDSLHEDLLVSEDESVEIWGLTQIKISTLGTVNLELQGFIVNFHVVTTDFPMDTDGILGKEYLRQERVKISFCHNHIIIHSDPKEPISFIDKESLNFWKNLVKNKGTAVLLKLKESANSIFAPKIETPESPSDCESPPTLWTSHLDSTKIFEKQELPKLLYNQLTVLDLWPLNLKWK